MAIFSGDVQSQNGTVTPCRTRHRTCHGLLYPLYLQSERRRGAEKAKHSLTSITSRSLSQKVLICQGIRQEHIEMVVSLWVMFDEPGSESMIGTRGKLSKVWGCAVPPTFAALSLSLVAHVFPRSVTKQLAFNIILMILHVGIGQNYQPPRWMHMIKYFLFTPIRPYSTHTHVWK